MKSSPVSNSSIFFKTTLSAVAGYLLVRIGAEFFSFAPAFGNWFGRFTPKWGATFILFEILCTLLLVVILLAIWTPQITTPTARWIAERRGRLGVLRWPMAAGLAAIPAWFFLFSPFGDFFTGPYIRLFFLLTAGLLAAICITDPGEALVKPMELCLAILLVGSIHVAANLLVDTTSYPFSLSWSEGNRFYDYSVQTDPTRYLYPGELKIPYSAPGRYLLWGIIFLIPNSPIWLHRLWNAILWTVPSFALGYLLARWCHLTQRIRWCYALWVFLFLAQGPIYPSLVLSGILVVTLIPVKRWYWSLLGVAAAGYYASASRWTWLPASATWAVTLMIADFKIEKGSKWQEYARRLAPMALVGIAGLAAGYLANPSLLSPTKIGGSISFSQPLLWYRLFPNATYHKGILIGILIAAGPLLALLLWLQIRGRWVKNWLQGLAYCSAGLVFLVSGLVISVKIGGGSNLHNLDMFLVSLALLSAIAFREIFKRHIERWPIYVVGLLAIAIVLPAWDGISQGAPRRLPSTSDVQQALEQISARVNRAQKQGEVLFIDQRQLLTFGYLQNVELESEYEKKYMMDQAMAGNANYFMNFYNDLAAKRFNLIVSEPLYTNEQDQSFGFREENNAWVKWIARPLLCYYAPVATLTDVRVQLLVPRANPENCP